MRPMKVDKEDRRRKNEELYSYTEMISDVFKRRLLTSYGHILKMISNGVIRSSRVGNG